MMEVHVTAAYFPNLLHQNQLEIVQIMEFWDQVRLCQQSFLSVGISADFHPYWTQVKAVWVSTSSYDCTISLHLHEKFFFFVNVCK